jgi:ring-1,2-phenylacetyl-CoA epoxidase subunit PaaC
LTQNSSGVQALLDIADDELVLGWRNSEWTGIAPFLEEDVAFSSIAQNEIGHARALYELAAEEVGTTADELAFDRSPEEYRCAQLVELKGSEDDDLAGLAAKIDREEAYHRMHALMWIDRLQETEEGARRLRDAVDELWPYSLGVLPDSQRQEFLARVSAKLPFVSVNAQPVERAGHTDDLRELWEEMTMVRRSVPGATW